MNDATRKQAIAIAGAIFSARDLVKQKDPHSPAAARAIEEAVSKARYLLEVIDRKLSCDWYRQKGNSLRGGSSGWTGR